MARAATLDELQQERAFNADTFAKVQSNQVDPNRYIQQQAAGLQQSVDAVRPQDGGTPAVSIASQASSASTGRFNERLDNLKSARQQVLRAAAAPGAEAKALANRAWRIEVDGWMAGLVTAILAGEIFLTPLVFFVCFLLRVFAGLMPLRLKGIDIIPPYTLRTLAGIGVFISHLTIFLIIAIVYTLIFFLIAFIVWFMTISFWEKVGFIWDLHEGAFNALYLLVTGKV